jgi:hypothetical protein
VEILVNHEGLDITASGTPDARTYVYSADVITVTEGYIGNDRGDPPPTIDMEIIARDLATTYLISGPPTQEQRFESTGSVGSVAGRFDVFRPRERTGG